MQPSLPAVRGPLTAALFGHWLGCTPLTASIGHDVDPLVDDDLHLALWCCHNLSYAGFAEIDDTWERDAETLAFRDALEQAFESALRDEHRAAALPADPSVALRVIGTWAGPPLARTVEEEGGRDELAEFAIHRCAYQLKEADPHTWVIPRLSGPGRSALLEIQIDEYGGGAPGEAHAELFAAAMVELGLEPEVGAHLDRLPGATLATDNLVTMFGLQRRLRGATVGHLALFEMCSVTPMTRYLNAARRVGGLRALERFYEVHVEIDAHHARVALDDMVGQLVAAEPDLAPEIIFGAAALSRVESRFARHVLTRWQAGDSSLLDPPSASVVVPDDVGSLVDRPPRHLTA